MDSEGFVGLFSGLIDKFKQGLQRTQELVLAPMGRLLGLRRLDEEQLLELEELLLHQHLRLYSLLAPLSEELLPLPLLVRKVLKLLQRHCDLVLEQQILVHLYQHS